MGVERRASGVSTADSGGAGMSLVPESRDAESLPLDDAPGGVLDERVGRGFGVCLWSGHVSWDCRGRVNGWLTAVEVATGWVSTRC